jgi:LysM repeat protein
MRTRVTAVTHVIRATYCAADALVRRWRPAALATLSLLLLASAVLACNLSASPPTPTPRPLLPSPTFFLPSPTPAFIATITPFPTLPGPVAPPCTPRTDWTVQYTVQQGDILSSIADRVGVTTAQLAQGNCITNPNLIQVGQRLRVPRQPAAVTPTPSRTPTGVPVPPGQPTITGLRVDPSTTRADGAVLIGLGQVTITALGVTNAVQVTFYISVSGQSPTILGQDTDGRDGWTTTYSNFSTSFSAQIWAVAISASGQNVQTAPLTLAYASPPTIGPLTITPGTANADGSVTIRPGQITLSVSGVQNATRVQFFFAASVTGASPQLLAETTSIVSGGAAVIWSFTGPPAGTTGGYVFAVASNAASQTATTASTPVLFGP